MKIREQMFRKILTAAFAFVMANFSLTMTTAAQTDISDGMVSYWTLDKASIQNKTVKDDWRDNDGEINGDPRTVQGKLDTALKFDGGDFIRFSPVEMDEGVSITAWINPESWDLPRYMTILGSWGPGDSQWYRLGFVPKGGKWTGNLSFFVDTGDAQGGLEWVQFDATKLEGWHHIAGIRDYKKGRLRLYVDGSEVSSEPFKHKFPVKPINLVMGARGDGHLPESFLGVVDEVALFNSILTEKDIRIVMTGGLKGARAVSLSSKLTTTWATIKVR